MRYNRVIGAVIVTALGLVLGTSRAAHAQGFAVSKFEPSERGSDWFVLDSMDYRGKVRPAIGVVGEYAHRTLATYDANGDLRDPVVRNQVVVHAGASLVLAERLRLAASLPIGLYLDGRTGTVNGVTFASPPDEQALGDLRLAADVRLFGAWDGPVRLALGGRVWLPTGSQKDYMGDGSTRIQPHLNVAGDVSIFTYAAQAGFTFRTAERTSFGDGAIGSELNLYGAVGVRLVDRRLTIGPEVFASTAVTDQPNGESGAFQRRSTPFEGLFGAHYVVGPVRLGAGVGTGFNRGFGAPLVRGLLNVEYQPPVEKAVRDSDGDGIPDDEDACVTEKGEPNSTDPSKHGCPLPKEKDDDQDKDGILDAVDACVDVAGVATSDPKTNGCPADTDGDGVLDAVDACVDVAGVATSDPKTNGCPADTDGDGVLDAVDACVDEPGKPDPDPKKNGCPKAVVRAQKIEILDQVKFETGSARLGKDPQNEEVLLAVFTILKEHPEIAHLSIEGHTDDRGVPAANKKLSAERAKAVSTWLVTKGIAKERLTSAGFGQERPIDTNGTDAGRQNNRRVEFRIVGADGKAAPATKGGTTVPDGSTK